MLHPKKKIDIDNLKKTVKSQGQQNMKVGGGSEKEYKQILGDFDQRTSL